MTTIYPGIAASLVPLTSLFSYYGTSWRVIRPHGGEVSARTYTYEGTITDFGIVPNSIDKAERGLPDVDVFGTDWFGWGPVGLDIRVGDVLVSVDDPMIAFTLLGPARTHLGPLIAPLDRSFVPRSIALQASAGYQAGLRIGAF